MPKFLYFKEGDSAENNGQVHRVPVEEAKAYLLRKLDGTDVEISGGVDLVEARQRMEAEGVVFKFKPVEFKDWTPPAEWAKDEQGRLTDPVNGLLHETSGEPL